MATVTGALDRIKALAKRKSGNVKSKKVATEAFRMGSKAGESRASKGLIPALAAGTAVGALGVPLAEAGKLSIVIGEYRIPIVGTVVSLLSAAIAWYLRKRPIAKVFWSVSFSAAGAQIADVVKHGFKVKKPATQQPAAKAA